MGEVFKALSDAGRRRILQLLKDGPMAAGDIAAHLPITKATLSGHFHVLKAAGLVTTERQGAMILYRLNTSVLEEALLHFMVAIDLLPRAARADDTGDAR